MSMNNDTNTTICCVCLNKPRKIGSFYNKKCRVCKEGYLCGDCHGNYDKNTCPICKTDNPLWDVFTQICDLNTIWMDSDIDDYDEVIDELVRIFNSDFPVLKYMDRHYYDYIDFHAPDESEYTYYYDKVVMEFNLHMWKINQLTLPRSIHDRFLRDLYNMNYSRMVLSYIKHHIDENRITYYNRIERLIK